MARLLADIRLLGVDEKGAPRKAVVFSAHLSAIRHLEVVLEREGELLLWRLLLLPSSLPWQFLYLYLIVPLRSP